MQKKFKVIRTKIKGALNCLEKGGQVYSYPDLPLLSLSFMNCQKARPMEK